MRIGLNGTAYDSLSSGARDRFANLFSEVARLGGHELVVYSPREVALGPLFPVPVEDVRSPLSPRSPLRRFRRSRRFFARRAAADRLDLFVTDHFPVITGAPTLLTIHDLRYLVLPREGSLLRRLYFRTRYAALAARAAAVVTPSETIRGEVRERLGLPGERVRVVPNGVRGDLAPAGADAVARVRRDRGLPERYLLHLGVLERRKNLPVLLRAMAEDPALPPLVLYGRGGPEEGVLRALARHLSLVGRVHFAGYVTEEDLPALLTGAAALAIPSRYEGFGLPVVQAFACGTPVVAARAGALPEVADGAALLVEPDDPGALAAALSRASGDREARARLVAAGRARAAAFTWEAAARRLLDVLPVR